ncbi:MAG: hypothetical protein JJD92_06485 [Frankiaceae bacterium]|nr:hypothetical protein [Frankiaceae bacterium]
MSVRRRAPLLLAFWLAAVVVATGVGVLAVRLVAVQVGDPASPVLSTKEVGAALTETPRASPTPSPSPTPIRAASPRPTTPAPTVPRSFSSQGGTVGVRCRGTVAERVFATPAQGYVLDETSVEAGVLEVRFEQGRTRVRLAISCSSRTPVLVERRVDTSGSDD